MKIAILGGGGFIGSATIDRLIKDGHELKVFERPGVLPHRKFYDHESVEWITGNISKPEDIFKAIEGVEIIIHLISTTQPKNSNDDPIYDVESNLLIALKLLNAMVVHQVPKIIFLSSGGTVYGRPVYIPVDEKHPTDPIVSYGATKLAIEKYIFIYQSLYGIKGIILRVSNPFGERQKIETAQGAIGVFLSKAILNQPITIWGDGNVIRDYIYVEDLANAIANAVIYEGDETVFNISSAIGRSLNQIIDTIEIVLNQKVVRSYHKERLFDVPLNVLDNKLAKSELGWELKTNFEDGVARTAQWFRSSIGKV